MIFKDDEGFRVEIISIVEGEVEFARQGGGFVARLSDEEFFARFKPEPKQKLRMAFIGGEWFEAVFPCYTTDNRWNGWAIPYFTKQAADEFVLLSNALSNGNPDAFNYEYDEEKDCFWYIDPNYEDEGRIETFGEDVMTVDGVQHLYRLGDGWCWNFNGWVGGDE